MRSINQLMHAGEIDIINSTGDMGAIGKEGKREREGGRAREIERDRAREIERDRERETDRDIDRYRDRER